MQEVQDGRHFGNHDLISTSYDAIRSCCGRQTKHFSSLEVSLSDRFTYLLYPGDQGQDAPPLPQGSGTKRESSG